MGKWRIHRNRRMSGRWNKRRPHSLYREAGPQGGKVKIRKVRGLRHEFAMRTGSIECMRVCLISFWANRSDQLGAPGKIVSKRYLRVSVHLRRSSFHPGLNKRANWEDASKTGPAAGSSGWARPQHWFGPRRKAFVTNPVRPEEKEKKCITVGNVALFKKKKRGKNAVNDITNIFH